MAVFVVRGTDSKGILTATLLVASSIYRPPLRMGSIVIRITPFSQVKLHLKSLRILCVCLCVFLWVNKSFLKKKKKKGEREKRKRTERPRKKGDSCVSGLGEKCRWVFWGRGRLRERDSK